MSALPPIPFAVSRLVASLRHKGFATAWQYLAIRRPATFLPIHDFMHGTKRAFDFLNDKLAADKSALQDVTSGDLWEMIREMPSPEEAGVAVAKPAFIETSAFISGLALPDSLPGATLEDKKQASGYYDDQSDDGPAVVDGTKKLAVKVKFFSLVVSGKSSLPTRRVDELEFETDWDATNGVGEWKIAAIN